MDSTSVKSETGTQRTNKSGVIHCGQITRVSQFVLWTVWRIPVAFQPSMFLDPGKELPVLTSAAIRPEIANKH